MSLIDRLLGLPLPILDYWGYFVLFFAALFEGIPGLGLLVPGQLFVVLGGFLARLHVFRFYEVFVVCAVGAIVGDLTGYFIGREYGNSFITRFGKYLFFKEEYYKKTKRLMHGHTGKMLLFGRFNSLTRAFVPFVAGASKVRFSKFIFFNVLGGISWAFAYTSIGYIFGHSYKIAVRYFDGFVISVIVLVIASFFVYKFLKRQKKLIN